MNYIEDKEFGEVYVSFRANMRNITMRWKGGSLYMNAPYGTGVKQLREVLDTFRVKLRAGKDKGSMSYHIGQVIQCYRLTLTIGEQERRSDLIIFNHNGDNVDVLVPRGIDLDEPSAKKWVSRALRAALDGHAGKVLIPLAQDISKRLGVAPVRYEIGHGLRKLGHCTRDKVIQLSANLMFLPEELIELTICHELAHLTHMNHSPQFHALVDKYLGGRERELERRLKAFCWPVM